MFQVFCTSQRSIYTDVLLFPLSGANCCYGLTIYVSRQLRILQKSLSQCNLGKRHIYREAFFALEVLSLTIHLELTDNFMLSKIITGCYHPDNLRIRARLLFVRGELNLTSRYQAAPQGSRLFRTEQPFFSHT